MAWYNFWKKKPAPVVVLYPKEPAPEVPFVAPEPIVLTPQTIYKSNWRNGMWVMTASGVGIIHKLDYLIEVHLVNEQGETINSLLAIRQQLRQATFKEIPASRRVGLTAEKAQELGYM